MLNLTKILVLMMLAGCDKCGPQHNDYVGCAAACGMRGVRSVTYVKCECGEPGGAGRLPSVEAPAAPLPPKEP